MEHHVVADRHRADAALLLPVARQQRDPGPECPLRGHLGQVVGRTVDLQLTAETGLGAEQQIGDVLEARAQQTGQAEHLALVDAELGPTQLAPDHTGHCGLHRQLTRLTRGGGIGGQATADDHPHKSALIGLLSDDRPLDPAVAEHGRPVGEREDLVEVMGDEEHARVLGDDLAHQAE